MKSFFRKFGILMVRNVIERMGGTLTSRYAHEMLLLQRGNALAELAAVEEKMLIPGLVCIVFSRDRALQLHALLDTYLTFVINPVPLYVVYNASSQAHQSAYNELVKIFKERTGLFTFENEEGDFKNCLLAVLSKVQFRSVMFLVDDLIFIREVDFFELGLIDPTSSIVSLRLSPHLKRSYTANMPQLPPVFRDSSVSSNMVEFDWFKRGNEWSYPWSVDGHILSLAEVRVISRISLFRAPNSYENCLKSFNDIALNRKGVCFRESIILNLPINKVQNEINNKSGEIYSDTLLEYWCHGLALDTRVFNNYIPTAPHEEHILSFMARK